MSLLASRNFRRFWGFQVMVTSPKIGFLTEKPARHLWSHLNMWSLQIKLATSVRHCQLLAKIEIIPCPSKNPHQIFFQWIFCRKKHQRAGVVVHIYRLKTAVLWILLGNLQVFRMTPTLLSLKVSQNPKKHQKKTRLRRMRQLKTCPVFGTRHRIVCFVNVFLMTALKRSWKRNPILESVFLMTFLSSKWSTVTL